MWKAVCSFFGSILSSLLKTYLDKKETTDLHNEKLERMEDAITLKDKEAEVMAAPSRSKSDVLYSMRARAKANSDSGLSEPSDGW